MSTPPLAPFWFRQRQGTMEAAGPETYKLTAPNLADAFISIRPSENGGWVPVLKVGETGPEEPAPAASQVGTQDAWDAAFELYRQRLVV